VSECDGKLRYGSEKSARASAHRTERHRASKGSLHAYLCDRCHEYHVGHKPDHIAQTLRGGRRG
jgi:hypothetical protein